MQRTTTLPLITSLDPTNYLPPADYITAPNSVTWAPPLFPAAWLDWTIECFATTVGAAPGLQVLWTVDDVATEGDGGVFWQAVSPTTAAVSENGVAYTLYTVRRADLPTNPACVKLCWTEGGTAGAIRAFVSKQETLPDVPYATPKAGGPERIYCGVSHSNDLTSPVDPDPRLALVSGSLSWATYAHPDADTVCDRPAFSYAPGATSTTFTATCFQRLVINNGCAVQFTPTDSNVVGFVVLGDLSTRVNDYYTFAIDGAVVATNYQPAAAGLPAGLCTWPIWGITGLTPGSHTLKLTIPTIGGVVGSQYDTPYMVAAMTQQNVASQTVVVIGDSYAANPHSLAWYLRRNLREWYPQSRVEVVVRAQSGYSHATFLQGNVNGLTALDLLLAAYGPCLVIDTLDRNDPSFSRAQADQVAAKVKAAGAQYWVYTPWSTGYTAWNFTEQQELYGAERGIVVSDAGRLLGTSPMLVYNSHPSHVGAAWLGEDMARQLAARWPGVF